MEQPEQLALHFGGVGHRNHYLFSDHYLDALLPGDPRWAEALPEAQAFLAWLAGLYEREQAQLAAYNESQLEEHWIKPILARLGHVYEGQASVPGLEKGIKKPDYVFFPDEAARKAVAGLQKKADYAATALAVGEAKAWDVPLGKKSIGGGPQFTDQNPMWQADYYLRAAGLKWAILTNGRLWRLLHADSSHQLTVHYEVDLLELLHSGKPDRLRYFTLFFKQAAFRPDAQGRHFLDEALAASRRYAVELEEDLQENVYSALESLMQGFLDLPANQLGADDLPAIYSNSLYLLYRLLFVLYAESRGLLPLERESYREHYSLHDLKNEIARGNVPRAGSSAVNWRHLQTLFEIINGHNVGLNRELGVPRYNGGLFDPQEHPFLAQYAVADAALVRAIDLLSRRKSKSGQLEFVDYRTLGVRQLGSIYEGLLEYQPRLEKRIPETQSFRDSGPVDSHRVVLATDKGERKATGSYYTPEYIVEYIVENTLGPLVEEATERVRARGQAAGAPADKAAAAQSFVDEILSLKVLDPAMGSGHFLVNATDYLALALATDPYVQTERTPEEDVVYWRRRVVERCIYGVDKNPLAVELAKLSLWLATVARERPLSFLDHHLKCGDSLVGARVAEVGYEPPVILSKRAQKELEQRKAGQMSFFELRLAGQLPAVMGRVLEITGKESDSYEAVQSKEAADEAVRGLKAPYEAVADLWVSAYFGNDFSAQEYNDALNGISQPGALFALPAVQRARQIAGERRFFHWELAFPEVFYDEYGQSLGERAGFDAVIGNPPYGLTESLAWFGELQNDAFVYFWKRAIDLCRHGGFGSLITPTAWLTGVSYENLRQVTLNATQLVKLVSLPYDVFSDAYIDTCIATVLKGVSSRLPVKTKKMGKREDGRNIRQPDYAPIDPELWRAQPFTKFVLNIDLLGMTRFDRDPDFVQLGDIVRVERGVQPYSRQKHTEAQIAGDFLRVKSYPSAATTHQFIPELLGEELGRYSILPKRRTWLEYSERLASRRDLAFFTEKRVVLRRLLTRRRELQAATTSEHLITTDNILNILVKSPEYSEGFIAALVNSRLIAWMYTHSSAISVKDDFPQVTYEELKRLPIRRIESHLSNAQRVTLLDVGRGSFEDYCNGIGHLGIMDFVNHHLNWQPAQVDIVHDLLAYLAEQMIAMNKEKQAMVEAFWLDLEGVTEARAFAVLRKKGKSEQSLAKSPACLPFVNAASHSTRTLDESLAWDEEAFKAFVKLLLGPVSNLSALVAVYRQRAHAYAALSDRLARTDRLIDQIVYKLYGLTEEEIAIVEGREQ